MLTNEDIHRFFWQVFVVLTLMLLSAVLFSQMIVRDYKNQILTHDYKIVGYMLEHGARPSDVSSAFAAEESERLISAGKSFLQIQGYKENMTSRLLPGANELLIRYRLIFVLFAGLLGFLLLIAFFQYFKRQQNTIEKADTVIKAFMAGDTNIRIDSDEEGSLFKLFASINAMATSLNSYIETEKSTKDFLKNMISDISHQLKTPLAALKMYNEIIQEESGNEEIIKNSTVRTESSLERMEILIQNLLKITKLDAGTIILNKREQNIREIVQESVYSLETRAVQEQKSITLKGSDDAVLYCDEDWIIEAIGNLVKNSLDHMSAGGKVEVSWDETPVITKIIIKDNGSGIHPEDIHHIFKRFYRSRFSQDTQGVGLGLSLSKSIVEAHNGTITADSALGKGSSFTLDFLKLTNM